MNGTGAPPRSEYNDAGSIVGYIPDDVSSVHSSAIGGVGIGNNNFPPMFQGFTDQWPTLPRGVPGKKTNGVASSVAGESIAASEITDTNGSAVGQGGVSLAGLSLNDIAKPTSLSQSDRLKRYVEGEGRATPNGNAGFVGAGRGHYVRGANGGLETDDDARSISTAFASQVGMKEYD